VEASGSLVGGHWADPVEVPHDLPAGIVRWTTLEDTQGQVADFEVLAANPAGAALLGYASQHLVGRRLRADLGGSIPPGLWAALARVWQTGHAEQYEMSAAVPQAGRRLLTIARSHRHIVWLDVTMTGLSDVNLGADGDSLLRRALDASDDSFAVYRAEWNSDGSVAGFFLIFLNAAAAGAYEGDANALVGLELREFLPGAVELGLWQAFIEAMTTGKRVPVRGEIDGGSWRGIFEGIQVPLGGDLILSTWRDVTERVHAERALALAYEETGAVRSTLQTALDATSDAFAVYDVRRDSFGRPVGLSLIAINKAGASPLAAGPEELIGRDLLDFFPEAVETGLWNVVIDSLSTGTIAKHRVDVRDVDGQWQAAFDNTVAPAGDNRLVITWRDVSEVVAASRALSLLSEQAHHDATHDALTGLPNRALFLDRLEFALASEAATGRTGLLFVDLDHFKAVNDTWGHTAGDLLLVAVAERLSTLVRREDTLARLGGDEFVLVLRDLPSQWSATELFDRVAASLGEPLALDETDPASIIRPQASLGLVLSPPFEPDVESMLRAADHAMYDSKRAGRGRGTVAGEGLGSRSDP